MIPCSFTFYPTTYRTWGPNYDQGMCWWSGPWILSAFPFHLYSWKFYAFFWWWWRSPGEFEAEIATNLTWVLRNSIEGEPSFLATDQRIIQYSPAWPKSVGRGGFPLRSQSDLPSCFFLRLTTASLYIRGPVFLLWQGLRTKMSLLPYIMGIWRKFFFCCPSFIQ